MVIAPGTPGSGDWLYQMNPQFMTLAEKKSYNGTGIGSFALSYGNPEQVFCFPKPTYATQGYNIKNSTMILDDVDPLDPIQDEFRYRVSTSNIICNFTTYKWAILKIPSEFAHRETDEYTIYMNVNGVVDRYSSYYNTAGNGAAFMSTYLSRGTKNWEQGSSETDRLTIKNLGQSVNSEYERIMFVAEEAHIGDAGYDAMVEYLRGNSAYPGGSDHSTDPYSPYIPPSQPGGGTGNGRIYDIVDEPSLPNVTALGWGFVSLFAMTPTELRALGAKLWSDDFFDNIIKNFQSPFDALLSLSIMPLQVTGTPNQDIIIGNYQTGVDGTKVLNQYVSYDLGTCSINEEIGSYLDYSPYTRLTLFLPYIGFVGLTTDDFMNSELSVKYHIDLLSGSCVAYIFKNGYVHSQYSGNISTQLPLSGRDMSSLYESFIRIGLSAVGTVATGGMASALSAGALAASASTVMNSKDRVLVGGSIQGSTGILGVQKPYVIIESPNLCLPDSQNWYTGYPSYMTSQLGSLSGYTEVDTIHLEGIPCTGSELAEIESLLKTGVIL